MAFDQSQIGEWLLTQRKARKLSRKAVERATGVAEKSLQRYEIEGVSAPAETFLTLAIFYGVKDLLKLIGRWEKAVRPAANAAGEGGARHAR